MKTTIISPYLKAMMLACCSLLLASCASIVSKSAWPVSISSNPSGATVTVTNARGQNIHTATTPTTVTLKSSAGFFKPASYTLTFTSKGRSTHTVPLKAHLNGWYVGNIVIGGLPGLLIVDPITGAMWRLDDRVSTDLGGGHTDANGAPQLRIVQRSSIPSEWEGHLVAIK